MEEPRVTYDERAQRYEIFVGAQRAGFADAQRRDGVVVMAHTVVDPAFGGRGLGGVLVRAALDAARAAGDKVDPQCSFVSAFIAKNPEYADLVG